MFSTSIFNNPSSMMTKASKKYVHRYIWITADPAGTNNCPHMQSECLSNQFQMHCFHTDLMLSVGKMQFDWKSYSHKLQICTWQCSKIRGQGWMFGNLRYELPKLVWVVYCMYFVCKCFSAVGGSFFDTHLHVVLRVWSHCILNAFEFLFGTVHKRSD